MGIPGESMRRQALVGDDSNWLLFEGLRHYGLDDATDPCPAL